MNRYTVVYLAEAEDNLIVIWADATDRDQVTESADLLKTRYTIRST